MNDETRRAWTRPPDVTSPAWEVTERSITVDEFALEPDFDAMEHMVADVPPEKMYAALRHLDLLTVHSRIADLAMWVRDLPERLNRRVPRRVPTRLTFDDLVASEDWVLLGEQPGREVIYGAIGRFWTPIVRMEQVSVADFVQYRRSGRGKIVAAMSVRPYGRRSSLVTYDIRTILNDPMTRRIFGLYWRTVSPFVRSIMRATLRTAAEQAGNAQK
jgi:hypothetical protein